MAVIMLNRSQHKPVYALMKLSPAYIFTLVDGEVKPTALSEKFVRCCVPYFSGIIFLEASK